MCFALSLYQYKWLFKRFLIFSFGAAGLAGNTENLEWVLRIVKAIVDAVG